MRELGLTDSARSGAALVVGKANSSAERELSAREILDQLSDGFALLDADLRHAYVNEAGARLVGMTPDDLVGKGIDEVYPGVLETPFYEAVRAVQAGEQAVAQIDEFFEPLERWYRIPPQLEVFKRDDDRSPRKRMGSDWNYEIFLRLPPQLAKVFVSRPEGASLLA